MPIGRRSLLACLAAASVTVLVLAAVLYAPRRSPETVSAQPRVEGKPTTLGGPVASCPRALEPGPRAPEEVLRALRRAVPRTWHYTTMDGPLKLSAENTLVLRLQALVGDSRSSTYYRKLAERACGKLVALRSWLAVVYFPTSQSSVYAERFAFFAKTRSGWRIWYRS